MISTRANRMRVVALISGSGSNLQALIDAMQCRALPIDIVAVISSRADAFGLRRAEQAGIATAIVDPARYATRDTYDIALKKTIDEHSPQLVVLAGFMRILTPDFVAHYADRMLNVHPSLLPVLRGLHTHRRALETKEARHGASIHFVTSELDGGPVVLQASVVVRPDDTPETLAKRVQTREHMIFPLAVRWFAAGRLYAQGQQAWLDGKSLNQPLLIDCSNV